MAEFQDWRPPDDEPLTDHELSELSEALGDGFTSLISVAQFEVGPVEGWCEEPFWGSTLRLTEEDLAGFEEFRAELRADGYTDGEIAEKYMEYIEDGGGSEAPRWNASNPFRFQFEKLESFFLQRCRRSLGEGANELLRGNEFGLNEVAAMFRPFSRTWFELHICRELHIARYYFNDNKTNNRISSRWALACVRHAGIAARMIESYRWRFGYGAHALRGRSVISSASAGGVARARAGQSVREQVLANMEQLVTRGISVSQAADLVARKGLGTSKAANRKLWQRYAK